MQCEEHESKPESIRKLLVQQVDEQSPLCDVTIKVGHWEKKFHHCVLVASPFFDHALNDNFLEKQTGTLVLRDGTPLTVEMAIMFLYGKRPKLTVDNIESMIDLAEFLLLPNLKSVCISWLNTVTVTEENCMHLLQLSSIYDFEIKTCTEYLLGHMQEMLHHSQIVNLSNESVQYLFSERKLSYVPMDDRVTFLVRWASSQPERRRKYLKELFEMVDCHEVSKIVLDVLKANPNVCKVIDLENIESNAENDIRHPHRVLLMTGADYGTLWCLDLEREKWYRLNSEAYKEEMGPTYHCEIAGASGVNSEIYFMERNFRYTQSSQVRILNVEEDVCKTYEFFYEDNCQNPENIHGYCIIGDVCIAYVNEQVEINSQTIKETVARDLPRCLPNEVFLEQEIEETDSTAESRYINTASSYIDQNTAHRDLIRCILNGGLRETGEDDNTMTSRYIKTATLYIGYIKDGSIKLSPLLSFKDKHIEEVCINKVLSVAVLFESRVLLFDLVDYKIETMHLQTKYTDRLVQTDDGFIIYDNKRCICLTRISIGQSLPTKFLTKDIPLEIKDLYENKYIFCGNTWYRYYRKKCEDHFIFESASHTDVLSKYSIENVNWKDLPLPAEEMKCYSSTIKDSLFQIRLPKNKLRCDTECPHCKLRPKSSERSAFGADYDSNYIYFDDSSDDEHYRSKCHYDEHQDFADDGFLFCY